MEIPFYTPDSYTRCNSIGWMFRHLKQSFTRQAGVHLSKEGLTPAQWAPLMTLHFGGTSTVAALGRELDIDPGAMTRLLDRLQAKGLCQRDRSTEDRRVVNVSLTDEGRRLTAKLPSVLSDVFNAHLQGFSHEEWQLLLSLLQRMIANGEALRQNCAQGSQDSQDIQTAEGSKKSPSPDSSSV